jgi:hypothetical protein
MWSVAQPSSPPWSIAPLEPAEVLYEFDGPLTFTCKFGFFDALFHKAGERSGIHFFLAVETNEETITALRDGKISVRGALNRRHAWIIEVEDDLRVKRYWNTPMDNVPEGILPKRGAPLHSYMTMCPDSLEQANSFFSIAFVGKELSAESVPFSLLKTLIDESYEAARRLLSPMFMLGAKSATYDFPARTIPGSLILALDEPQISASGLRRRTLDAPISMDAAREQFSLQRESFFDEMNELIEKADHGQISDAFAEENYFLLDKVQNIIPSEENRIDRVVFARNSVSGVRALIVDENAGVNLHRAFKRLEKTAVTDAGKIEIVNGSSKYFVYRSIRGKQVSCFINPEIYNKLEKSGLIKSGATVSVKGRLSKRANRDIMHADEAPIITI